jgi:thymidylate synthase (FAD)
MRLIKPSFEIIEQEPGLEGIYKAIELAGRNCYKSESNIKEGSAKEFVDRMIKSKHLAMCEHGTVYLKDTYDVSTIGSWRRSIGGKYSSNKYSVVNTDRMCDFQGIYITTNFRVLVENNWLDDLQYLCDPTEFHEKRIMVRFICDRGVSHKKFVA